MVPSCSAFVLFVVLDLFPIMFVVRFNYVWIP